MENNKNTYSNSNQIKFESHSEWWIILDQIVLIDFSPLFSKKV